MITRQEVERCIEAMPRDSFGALISTAAYGVARAIKRGEDPLQLKVEDVPGHPSDEIMKEIARDLIVEFSKSLGALSAADLDDAATLYRAHLVACGYNIEEGYDQ